MPLQLSLVSRDPPDESAGIPLADRIATARQPSRLLSRIQRQKDSRMQRFTFSVEHRYADEPLWKEL